MAASDVTTAAAAQVRGPVAVAAHPAWEVVAAAEALVVVVAAAVVVVVAVAAVVVAAAEAEAEGGNKQ